MIKVRCPICATLLHGSDGRQQPEFPFCSARCKLIDLGRWLGGTYAIEPEEEEGDPAVSDDEYCIP
jgi:endogenous inhibitor of DNA gyrase (YacG/DUF329 family)